MIIIHFINQTHNTMKKILTALAAVLMIVGCKKETPEPDGNAAAAYDTVDFHFSPYQMSPMKSNAVGTVCSRLDIYIIDTAAGDTMRWHQVKADDPTGFGTLSVVLQTNKHYRLVAVGHNTADTCTYNGGIVSFAGDQVKQSMVAQQWFCPADSLSLSVTMQRIVGMFKLRIGNPDSEFGGATHFRFVVDSAYNKWDMATMSGAELAERTHTINGTSRGADGYVTYNVYVIPDNLTGTRTVDIGVTALDAQEAAVESRLFPQVPIKAGYVTSYTGNFFITFDMGFQFGVGDWELFPDQPY